MARDGPSGCGWRSAALCLLVSALAPTASAQGIASSFDQLRLLVRPGDAVSVTDDSGREVTGRIAELTPATLTVVVGGNPREWTEKDVTKIRHRRSDPLSNGALWGLGIGAALAATSLAATYEGDANGEDAAMIALLTAMYGGIGAGIGVGVDALITGRQVIYERPSTAANFSIAPLWTTRHRGVLASWRF